MSNPVKNICYSQKKKKFEKKFKISCIEVDLVYNGRKSICFCCVIKTIFYQYCKILDTELINVIGLLRFYIRIRLKSPTKFVDVLEFEPLQASRCSSCGSNCQLLVAFHSLSSIQGGLQETTSARPMETSDSPLRSWTTILVDEPEMVPVIFLCGDSARSIWQ